MNNFQKECKVLQLTFDAARIDGEIVRDHSLQENDVRMINKIKTGIHDGKHGQAINLMHSGKLLLPANFHGKPKEGVGISVWMKLNQWSASTNIFRTIGRDMNVHYELSVKRNKIKWSHIDDSGRQLFNVVSKRDAVTPHKWYHVVGTYDGKLGVANVWLDGQLLNNRNYVPGTLSQDWSVTSEFGGRTRALLMDNVCMFRCFLSRDKVAALYIQGS